MSTGVPNRQMVDWPKDVKAFVDGIGMKQFAVMGLSGGGPFAVACAYSLPRSMLTSVGLFASGPPWAAGRHYMTRTRRILSKMAAYWPGGLKLLLDMTLGLTRSLSRTGFVTRRIDTWLETVPAILKLLDVQHVSLMSHSAGTTYCLNTLYHFRDILDPARPYVTMIGTSYSNVLWLHAYMLQLRGYKPSIRRSRC